QISQYDQDIACGQLKSDRNPSKNRTQTSRLRQRSANFSSLLEPFRVRLKHSAGAGFRQGRGDWRQAYPKVRPSRSPLILAERCPARFSQQNASI
ncbi:hypothetical protein, partial [Rhizobium ruizarguesonis]